MCRSSGHLGRAAIHRLCEVPDHHHGVQLSSSCSMAYIAAAARVEMPILS